MPNVVTVPLTPEAYTAKCQQLARSEGIVINGRQGTLSKDGVVADYYYDGAHLTITVLHAPPFMMGHVMSGLTAALRANSVAP